MWDKENCLLVSYYKRVLESPDEDILVSEEADLQKAGTKAPKWLKELSPEELAAEIVEFKKKEFPQEYGGFRSPTSVATHYMSSKGTDEYLLTQELQMKVEKAVLLAEQMILNEEERSKKEKFEKEKKGLPELANHCVDFARSNGLKKITFADLRTFLMEKEIELSDQAQRLLYGMSNLRLKSKK
jgi:hypothetical protein